MQSSNFFPSPKNQFTTKHVPTIHADEHTKDYVLKHYHLTVRVLDIGRPALEHDRIADWKLYIQYGECFLLCYSLEDEESFFNLVNLRSEIIRIKQMRVNTHDAASKTQIPMILVGTHADR